ncbi:LPD38 domain-containing protein [Piscinibacter gummiphilus]|uniref:LPD38 domain-containing protein n=1 Tax=Piscinibacter gummiphilus TaxID=946333 RepID=A0ABZ0CNA2_9BURK|nr:LPD38 domain-containing protein [Piscinibacter gummiphilus]WOB06453.1 LPD38 domain-containing protein [Piscinibacter gummiphilus]
MNNTQITFSADDLLGSAPAPAPASNAPGAVGDFVRQYLPAAERVAKQLGVEPQVVLGQWGLETGWGRSIIPGTNNLGNIKDFSGGGVAATDNMNGSRDKYRQYGDANAFADDFTGLIGRRYRGAMGTGADANRYFAALKAGGYAEDPGYVEKGVSAASLVASAMGAKPATPATSFYGKPAEDRYIPIAKAPGPATAGDYAKELGASAVDALGSVLQLPGEIAAAAANKATGTEDYEGFNPLKGFAESIRGSMTEGGKRARLEAAIKGDFFDPSTWETPPTAQGWGMVAANGFGSLAATLLPFVGQAGKLAQLSRAARAAEAAGDVAKASQIAAEMQKVARVGKVVGAASGGAMTGGAAADEARQNVSASVGQMTHEQLLAQVPAYAEVFNATGDQDQARKAVVNGAARWAGGLAALAGAAGGAFNAKVIEDAITQKGIAAMVGNSTASRAGRAALGGAGGAVAEGGQELTEKVGQNAGENIAMGRTVTDDVTRDSAGDVIGGAMVGGALGGAGGGVSSPTAKPAVPAALAPVADKAAEPDSPLSRAAIAGATAQQSVADAQPAPEPEVDPITAKVTDIQERVRSGGLLDALRNAESPVDVKTFVADLAKAASPSSDPRQREMAMARMELALGWADQNPPATVPPAGPAPTLEQKRAAVDRDAELLAQRDGAPNAAAASNLLAEAQRHEEAAEDISNAPGATPETLSRADRLREQAAEMRRRAAAFQASPSQGAGTTFDTEQIDAQRQVNLEQRLRAPAQATAAEPTATPGITASEQAGLEAAALAGEEANRRAEDAPRQAVLSRVMRNIEERGGVASPAEAQILAEAGAGKPYDRIDESLAPALSPDQLLTQATGIALDKAPRSSVTPANAPAEAAGQAAEQRAREDSIQDRAQRQRDQKRLDTNIASLKAATPASLEKPAADAVIYALKTIPALRTAEQKVAVQRARSTYSADQMRILEAAANLPADLSATDKLQLEQLRKDGAPAAPASAPAAADVKTPASIRKRREHIEQLAANGFETLERKGHVYVLSNTKTQQAIVLEGRADAQLARAAIARAVDRAASRANANPSDAQIAAENYRKGEPFQLNGVTIVIENPRGSIRRSKPGAAKKWETKMAHHYGDIVGTRGADGDKVDVFVGPRPDSAKIYVIDQQNQDGSFDEHKVMMGFTSEAEARAGYLANYEPGWTGLQAITEMTPEQFRSWVMSDAAKKRAAEAFSGTLTVSSDGKAVTLPLLSDESLADNNESPARGRKKVRTTKRQAKALREVAAIFGKEIQFFADPAGQVNADGFVSDADSRIIYLNESSGFSPMAVFGHELMHLLRRENPEAYDVIARVVAARLKDAEGFQRFYNSGELDQDKLLEELISDLNGDLLSDANFWREVFEAINAEHGAESKGIIARLAEMVYRIIDGAIAAFKGRKSFGSSQFIDDSKEVRAAFRDGLAKYIKEAGITRTAMEAEILRAAPKKSADRDESLDSFRKRLLDEVVAKREYAAMLARQHDWAFNVGDTLLSTKTGKTYRLVGRFFGAERIRKGEPTKYIPKYLYESGKPPPQGTPRSEVDAWPHDYEQGTFNESALLASETMKSLTTPRPLKFSTDRENTYTGKSTESSIDGQDNSAGGLGQEPREAGDRPAVPSYGVAREGAVSVVARHYSNAPREELSTAFAGTGLKGAERARLESAADARLRQRLNFYVDLGKGISPESGVGGYPHEVRLNNLYDPRSQLIPAAPANEFESAVLDAGFDGYLNPEFTTTQAAAVLLGEHAAVPVAYVGTAPAPGVQPLKKSLLSSELQAIDLAKIPGAEISAGTLAVPAEQAAAANVELERIGSPVRFSTDRAPGKDVTETAEFKRWFGDSRVVDASDAAQFASMYADQYADGEPGHADPKGLQWLEVSDYPISRLRDAVDAEWFRAEQQMWADEGEPDRFDDMLNQPIANPVVLYDDGNGGWTWDGNHRIGAALTKGRATIRALVGVPREQIKSAIGNDGNFDPASPNITKSADRQRVDPMEVSTRAPYAKAAKNFEPEDPIGSLLISNFEAGLAQPKWLAAVTELVEQYPNYREAKSATTPEKKLERMVRQMTDSLVWLHNQVPADTRERSKLWYDGARKIAERMAKKYDVTPAQAAGILAVLSPQKDWFMNVSLADRVTQIMAERQAFAWSKAMTETAGRIFGGEAYRDDLAEVSGRSLNELDSDFYRAMWLRVYDEAHNPRSFYIVSPEGDMVAEARTAQGELAKPAWGSLPTIAKAISIYRNGSFESINEQLGRKHKVRNFFNNILVPNSPNGHVTIDTHAVAAALLRPLSGNSIEVMHNFGGPSSAHAGLEGTYALYEEAYHRAAERVGLLPREMQSITWEAVRGLFTPRFKGQARNVEAIDKIWSQYRKGRLSYEHARDEVIESAGGIEEPGWAGRSPGAYAEEEPAADAGDVRVAGVAGQDAAAAGGGGAGVDSRAPEVSRSADRDGDGRPARRGLAPLAGAPSVAGAAGPDARLVEVAESYARANGIELRRQAEYVDVDPERAARIAAAYEAMPHAPQDPKVREAYENLIRQTVAQYRALEAAGYRFYLFDESNDPYEGNPWNAMRDLRANQVMGVFATEAGFGDEKKRLVRRSTGEPISVGDRIGTINGKTATVLEILPDTGEVRLSGYAGGTVHPARTILAEFRDGAFDASDNPLLADTGIQWPYGSLDGKPKRVLANDLFRAVHDAFGHGLEGAGFRARGEENAWQAHARLFTGSALGAITSETRGQNSWLNFGPNAEKNRTASVEETIFADQKTGLMPEWTWTEGRAGDIQKSSGRNSAADAEKALRSMGLDMLSDDEIDAYNESRFEGGAMNQEVRADDLQWVEHAGMMHRDFFVRDPSGASRGLLRRAWFYPDGVDGGDGSPVIVLEDENGNEIGASDGVKKSADRASLTWTAREQTEAGPIYAGKRFALVKPTRLEVDDFVEDDAVALPMGHASFVTDGNTPYGWQIVDASGAPLGILQAQVTPEGEIEAIHDIAIDNPRAGLGRDIVAHIAASRNGDVRIIEALPQSQPFWDKVGAGYYDANRNTTLDWETLSRAAAEALARDDGEEAAQPAGAIPAGEAAELTDEEARALGIQRSADRGNGDDTDPTPPASGGPKGGKRASVTIEAHGRGWFEAKVGKRTVGKLSVWRDSNNDLVPQNVVVDPRYRQRGIARQMYEAAEAANGEKLKPAVSLSDDAFEFWKRFRPEAVAGDLRHIKDKLVGQRAKKGDHEGVITQASGRGATLTYDRHPQGPGTHSTLVGADEINDALEAAGGQRVVPASMAIRRSTDRGDITSTPAFRKWFGDSKVVDADGKPLVVYHGTAAEFNVFDANQSSDLGFHFGPREVADFHAAKRGGTQVMPVYLAIRNPLRMRDTFDSLKTAVQDTAQQLHAAGVISEGERDSVLSETRRPNIGLRALWDRVQGLIEASGYDGVVYENTGQGESDGEGDSYIAFRPEQIKSATGNEGNFDPTSPDITKSSQRDFADTEPFVHRPGQWDTPAASRFDDLVYKLQDKHVDTKRVVDAVKEAGGDISDLTDVYLQEELFHGRAAKRTEDFVHEELQPLVDQMAKDGITIAHLDDYLHARHAREANAIIAQRNPEIQDGGSGMTNQEAEAYFAELPAEQRAKLDAAAAKVDAMLTKTRELMVDYELESRGKVDGWASMFKHYVPLMREDDGGHTGGGTGQGFSIKGKEVKGRTGSTRKVVDILANIAMQRERTIVRGEKNRVSRALFGLAASNENPEFWQVDTHIPSEKVFNPTSGQVEDRPDNLYKQRPNVVVTKIADEAGNVTERAVVFNEKNERAMRMAEALKNLDAAQLEGLLGASAKVTRYFASINTQYNPVFGVVNLVRDVQAAMVNLQATELKGKQKDIARNAMPALRGIYADLRAERKGKAASSPWAALWDEFQSVGGQTGYRQLFETSADRAKKIEESLNPTAWMDTPMGKIFTANGVLKVPLAQAQRAVKWIFDWLSDYNEAMENGIRLATYKAGIDAGLSKERAASIAKNLTTNFNRKGQAAQQAGALYAFFNASMQGSARIAQTIFTMEPGKPKTIRLTGLGKKIVYGGMLLGTMQAVAMAAAGFSDEDPPEFVRERGIVIPIGNKKYLTVPLPLGLHVIPGIGRITTEWALGGFQKTPQRLVSMLGMFAEAFNPIGNAGMSMQTLAPTALDPLVALTENKDWSGRPIAKESSNKAMPGHLLARDTSSAIGQVLSEAINYLSGGTQYTAGAFSPTPDQIDYLLGQVTGGVGRELSKVEQTAKAVGTGESIPTFKVPLVGRFVGDAKSQASEGTAFYANVDKLNELETEIKGLRKDGKIQEANELRMKSPQAYLITQANHAERAVQRLRREKSELLKSGAPAPEVKAIEERITARMAALNRAVDALREREAATQ